MINTDPSAANELQIAVAMSENLLKYTDLNVRPLPLHPYWEKLALLPESVLFTKNELFYSQRHLNYIKPILCDWLNKAHLNNIDIIKERRDYNKIIADKPLIKRSENDFTMAIILIYQNKMLRYYLCQIIRKVTLEIINKQCELYKLQAGSDFSKWKEINQRKKDLQDQTPPEVDLFFMPHVYHFIALKMDCTCTRILKDLAKIKEELLK